MGKGGEALLQKGSPPFPNLLLLPFALPELPHNGLGRDDAGGGCGHDVAGHAGAVAATKRLETDVSRSLDVATCVEKNLISGA